MANSSSRSVLRKLTSRRTPQRLFNPSNRFPGKQATGLKSNPPSAVPRGQWLLARYYGLRDTLLPLHGLPRQFYALLLDLFFPNQWANYFPALRQRFKAIAAQFQDKPGILGSSDIPFQNWINQQEPGEKALAAQRRKVFSRNPKISIIVPCFRTPQPFLKAMVQSVQRQTYPNWQLCLAIGGELSGRSRRYLFHASLRDSRIQRVRLQKNGGIAENSNAALKLAQGEFVALLDHDDCLAPFALHEVVKALNANPRADFLYSDEDKITADGRWRFDPYFKPGFSPDMLRCYNYISHLCVVKKKLLDSVGGFQRGHEGSQDYDLYLRLSEKAEKIIHIPKILYHWRAHSQSTAQHIAAKRQALAAAKKALTEHLQRVGLSGRVSSGLLVSHYRVRYKIRPRQKISILIPTLEQRDVLKACLDSILQKTTYPNFEIILVDSGSRDPELFRYYQKLQQQKKIRLLRWSKPFNYSEVNNFAAKRAQGDLLLFLNNDVKVLNHDWLENLVQFAQREDVGAVGAKLYYPDGTIQHGGVIVGLGGVAGHSHRHYQHDSPGYFGRLISEQNLSSVTGACLMMRKSVFQEVGGFDPRYPLAFNDVDLCLKIRQAGYLIVWTPYAELTHYESKTRGLDNTPAKQARFLRECRYFQSKWATFLKHRDPYYNPNLTLVREDFSIS